MAKIYLKENLFTLVDDSDFEYLDKFKWYVFKKNTYYVFRKNNHKHIFMHREILNILDSETKVDHKDNDGLNNRRSNLCICTNQQNLFNRRKHRNNKSGFKGVYFDKNAKKYHSQIMFNKKNINLGLYDSIKDAALAYNTKAIELFGYFAHLNNI